MPDVHAGSGCVIGFTADFGELVVPDIVGVDIGCGMLTIELGKSEPDYKLLDQAIHEAIPAGMAVYDELVATFGSLNDPFGCGSIKGPIMDKMQYRHTWRGKSFYRDWQG